MSGFYIYLHCKPDGTPFYVDLKVDGFRTEAIGNWPFSEFCKFVDMLIEGEVAHA